MSLSSAVGREHGKRVALLYKRILRLHKGLPPEMQVLGNEYVKAEFRKHKAVGPQETMEFMQAWIKYCSELSKQLSTKGIAKSEGLGRALRVEEVEVFREDQILQLYDLKLETEKPRKME